MRLPGFEADIALNEKLIDLQDKAAPLLPNGVHKPQTKGVYFRALAAAWEAGKLVPVKEKEEQP